jgi:CMP-N,N'-diacetyllegionaminic acid synthase
MQPIITIVARAGSKGLPNKHLLPFNGKPLIEWTIEQAKQYSMGEFPIVVSSDSEKILDIARDLTYSLTIEHLIFLIQRSNKFANDTAGKMDAIREAVKIYERQYEKPCDCVIDLDATNPCRRLEDIDKSFQIFQAKRPKTLFSVTKSKKNPYFNQIIKNNENFELASNTIASCASITGSYVFLPFFNRQAAPQLYDLNSNIYIYDAEWLRNPDNKFVITDNPEIYVMPEWTRHDIDSEYDFFDCENNFRKYILEGEYA